MVSRWASKSARSNLGGEMLPLRANDLEGAAVFVFELDALGHTVVDLGLI
jgi:hypothetical protein